MINLSKEQIEDMMTFTFLNPYDDEENLTAVIKVNDLMQHYEEKPQGEWITIEAGEDLLIDRHWYLIVHKDFGTPMKAKYHSDCPHFTFFYEGGEGCSYLFEDKVTHYMELPDIPMKGEEE